MTAGVETVTVYTTSTCPWCVRAKDFLRQKGVPFHERNVERDPVAAQDLARRTGQMGVPVITAGTETIVGFDRPKLEQLAARFAAPPPPPPDPATRPKVGLRVKNGSGGAEVGLVHQDSPAAVAGVRPGDIITEMNGRPVRSAEDLETVLGTLQAEQSVAIDLRRDGKRVRLRMAL